MPLLCRKARNDSQACSPAQTGDFDSAREEEIGPVPPFAGTEAKDGAPLGGMRVEIAKTQGAPPAKDL